MRSVWDIISSLVQLIFGALAVASFIVLAVNGENMTKWIPTLILAVALVILGVRGIFKYIKQK